MTESLKRYTKRVETRCYEYGGQEFFLMRIHKKLKKQLRLIAGKRGISMATFMREATIEHLKKYDYLDNSPKKL